MAQPDLAEKEKENLTEKPAAVEDAGDGLATAISDLTVQETNSGPADEVVKPTVAEVTVVKEAPPEIHVQKEKEPDSHESTTGKSIASLERSAAEEEILSTIEHVEDWAEESDSEEELEELEEEDEEEDEEEEEEKSVDGDRDRRNPQFIPRNGAYFLHDDRLHSDEEEEDAEGEKADTGTEGNKEDKAAAEGAGDTARAVPADGSGDATDKKPKSTKKTSPKKPTPASEAKKKPVKKAEPVESEKPEVERWGHDLYDESSQATKSHDEIKDRYGYDIRDDEQAPRGKRNRRYARPVDPHIGSGRGRGFRGSGRGLRRGNPPPRGAQGIFTPRAGPPPENAPANEPETPEVVEKENFVAQPGPGKVERGASRARGPRAARGSARPPEGPGSSRRPLQPDYQETWPPRGNQRYEEVPPSARGRGGPPGRGRPGYEYGGPPPPRMPRRPAPYYEEDYDDSYQGEYTSRVFFSSRGRGGPAPGSARRAPLPVSRGYPSEPSRPQPKLPLAPPARGPEKPIPASSQPGPAAPLSKRYSERPRPSIRPPDNTHTGHSDDVRSLGLSRGPGGGGGPAVTYPSTSGYRMPYQPAPQVYPPVYGPPPGHSGHPVAMQPYQGDYYGQAGYYPPNQSAGAYYQGHGGYAGGDGYYQ